jgi:hypothetical protein
MSVAEQRSDAQLLPSLAAEERRALEGALTGSVRLSLGLPVDDRLGFISRYLRAADAGAELPSLPPHAAGGPMDAATVSALAATLTAAVNATEGQPGSKLGAVASYLAERAAASEPPSTPKPEGGSRLASRRPSAAALPPVKTASDFVRDGTEPDVSASLEAADLVPSPDVMKPYAARSRAP